MSCKDHNPVTPVRLESVAPRSRVKHSTTEPLRSQVHQVMLYIKYQFSTKPRGNRQELFFMFHYKSLCKICDPWDGPIFGPGHNLN